MKIMVLIAFVILFASSCNDKKDIGIVNYYGTGPAIIKFPKPAGFDQKPLAERETYYRYQLEEYERTSGIKFEGDHCIAHMCDCDTITLECSYTIKR